LFSYFKFSLGSLSSFNYSQRESNSNALFIYFIFSKTSFENIFLYINSLNNTSLQSSVCSYISNFEMKFSYKEILIAEKYRHIGLLGDIIDYHLIPLKEQKLKESVCSKLYSFF
jgi:hypothetical protein